MASMTNYLSLTKVFLKNLKMSQSNNKKARRMFTFLLIFTLVFIIIPFLLISAIFVYDTTIQLMDINYESIGLQIMCYLVSIFTFVFTFPVILNEFYFSNDIEKLMPLPLKPVELIFSKFTACFIVENVVQVLLIFVSILSYILALKIKISNILLALIPILTLPIIPMVYAAIICLIIMYFAKFIKNKELIKRISSVFVIGLFFFFFFVVSSLKDFDFELYLENFANGNHQLLTTMNYIFPSINLFIDTLTNQNIISLTVYILINLGFIALFLILARFIYLDSAIGMSSKDTSPHRQSTKLLNNMKEHSIFTSYLSKEFKVLVRTPSFFINCIIINIFWPVFVYTLYKVGPMNYSLSQMQEFIIAGDSSFIIKLLLLITGISILLPAMNSIAASSFSREGKHFSFIKYIPVAYKTQWLSKFFISFIIAIIGINFYATIFYIIIGLSFTNIIMFYLISILAVSAISLIGVYIDSIQPKLIWDDENNALRENYNTFIAMGLAILIFGIICGGSYFYLYQRLNMTIGYIIYVIILCLLFINILFILLSAANGTRNIRNQEEA